MVGSIKLDSSDAKQAKQVASFFKKGCKIKYNKKITGKVKLYISEKNSIRSINYILSLYQNSLN